MVADDPSRRLLGATGSFATASLQASREIRLPPESPEHPTHMTPVVGCVSGVERVSSYSGEMGSRYWSKTGLSWDRSQTRGVLEPSRILTGFTPNGLSSLASVSGLSTFPR